MGLLYSFLILVGWGLMGSLVAGLTARLQLVDRDDDDMFWVGFGWPISLVLMALLLMCFVASLIFNFVAGKR